MLFESLIESSYVASQMYLHVFCDASMRVYGTSIYVQTVDAHDVFRLKLLCSKSCVAPVRGETATLPKLELYGAVVGLLYGSVWSSMEL